MANAIDKAVRAQGGGVVKPHQVKAMILAARRAFKVQSELGLVDDGVGFDAWRRATLHDVTGGDAPESFRTVTQRDYAAVIDYFRELAGEEGKSAATPPLNRPAAFKYLKPRSGDLIASDARARALWTLDLEEAGLAHAFEGGRGGARKYADALFWKIHKTERSLATPRQIWAVIFTLRKRARRTPARTGLESRGARNVPLSPPDGSARFPAFSRGL